MIQVSVCVTKILHKPAFFQQMARWVLLLLVSVCVIAAFDELDELVIRIPHAGGEHGQDLLKQLYLQGISSVENHRSSNKFFDVYITRKELKKVEALGLQFAFIDHPSHEENKEETRSVNTASYHHYNDLSQFLDQIQQLYPAIAKKFSIGRSSQGRELFGIRISKNIGL